MSFMSLVTQNQARALQPADRKMELAAYEPTDESGWSSVQLLKKMPQNRRCKPAR